MERAKIISQLINSYKVAIFEQLQPKVKELETMEEKIAFTLALMFAAKVLVDSFPANVKDLIYKLNGMESKTDG